MHHLIQSSSGEAGAFDASRSSNFLADDDDWEDSDKLAQDLPRQKHVNPDVIFCGGEFNVPRIPTGRDFRAMYPHIKPRAYDHKLLTPDKTRTVGEHPVPQYANPDSVRRYNKHMGVKEQPSQQGKEPEKMGQGFLSETSSSGPSASTSRPRSPVRVPRRDRDNGVGPSIKRR